ncbi:hypothetical protein CsSME_00040119 [Camellia sinensis var. sinensis]
MRVAGAHVSPERGGEGKERQAKGKEIFFRTRERERERENERAREDSMRDGSVRVHSFMAG